MTRSVHERVKNIIEETNYAFSYCRGSLNVDYAEFAAMSLFDFKNALHNPNLTGEELMAMLRDASAQYKTTDPNGCWSAFLAQYMSRGINGEQTL